MTTSRIHPGGTEELQTPTNSKASWTEPSASAPWMPPGAEQGTGCQQQSSLCQGRTKPWNLLYRWKSRVISPKAAYLQLMSQHKMETTRASTAKSRAHGGGMHGVHPAPRSALPTLGNWSSPMVAAPGSNLVHSGDGWDFPWFTATGERAQQSQNAVRRIRISAWAFVSSAQQKGHCPCSTD